VQLLGNFNTRDDESKRRKVTSSWQLPERQIRVTTRHQKKDDDQLLDNLSFVDASSRVLVIILFTRRHAA
jgi:hypothetical protein